MWTRQNGDSDCEARMGLAAGCLAATLTMLAGCTEKPETSKPDLSGVSIGAIEWSAEDNGHVIPGIDEAQIMYLGDFVVFWFDFPAATATSIGFGSDGDQLGGGIQLINADFGEIDCRYELTTRSSGTVFVAGETYDLSAGGLFLISARQRPIKVRQIDFDLRELKMTEKDLRRVIDSEHEIEEFFRKSASTP